MSASAGRTGRFAPIAAKPSSDETMIGGKAENRAYARKPPKKQTVLTLVDRDGESRSFHIAKSRL